MEGEGDGGGGFEGEISSLEGSYQFSLKKIFSSKHLLVLMI